MKKNSQLFEKYFSKMLNFYWVVWYNNDYITNYTGDFINDLFN